MKVAIIYTSLSGNTEHLAEVISTEIKQSGGECDVFIAGHFAANLCHYDLVLFGSYTWGDGKLPSEMRKELRRLLIDEKAEIKRAATFGTGDTQYHFFCRAVDEMRYHLNNHGVEVVGDGLKIEQFCQGSQRRKAVQWTKEIIKGESL